MWFYWKCKIVRSKKRDRYQRLKFTRHSWQVRCIETGLTVSHHKRFTAAVHNMIHWQRKQIKKSGVETV